MITIFTTAKGFVGQTAISQINAIRSWQALSPDVEVILFGDGTGYTETAQRLGIVHIPDVATSEQGTPLVNSMFALARAHGRYRLQMYVNADIVLLDDFLEAIRQIDRLGLDRFMMIGQRWDLDWNQEINFACPVWQAELHEAIAGRAALHPPAGSDYFVYRGSLWDKLPTMVVGRAGYDNELIFYCRANRVPVIDASPSALVVHQNHDYGHHPQGVQGVWWGEEAQLNRRPGERRTMTFTLVDADWRLEFAQTLPKLLPR